MPELALVIAGETGPPIPHPRLHFVLGQPGSHSSHLATVSPNVAHGWMQQKLWWAGDTLSWGLPIRRAGAIELSSSQARPCVLPPLGSQVSFLKAPGPRLPQWPPLQRLSTQVRAKCCHMDRRMALGLSLPTCSVEMRRPRGLRAPPPAAPRTALSPSLSCRVPGGASRRRRNISGWLPREQVQAPRRRHHQAVSALRPDQPAGRLCVLHPLPQRAHGRCDGQLQRQVRAGQRLGKAGPPAHLSGAPVAPGAGGGGLALGRCLERPVAARLRLTVAQRQPSVGPGEALGSISALSPGFSSENETMITQLLSTCAHGKRPRVGSHVSPRQGAVRTTAPRWQEGNMSSRGRPPARGRGRPLPGFPADLTGHTGRSDAVGCSPLTGLVERGQATRPTRALPPREGGGSWPWGRPQVTVLRASWRGRMVV